MENNQEQLAPQPVPSESPQAPQPSSPKPTMLKWLLIALLFSLAVFGGVLYVQNTNKSQIATVVPTQIPQIISSPTPDSTANWKTYSSLEYGFSIMYPYGWFIWEQIPGVSTISLSNKKEGFNIDKTDGVVVTINPEGSDLFDVLSKLKPTEKLTKDLVIYTKIEDIKIGNSSAVQFSADRKAIPGDGLISGDEILIQKKNIVLSVRLLGGSQEAMEMNKQIFNQILQTFKFLDQQVEKLSCSNVEPNAGSGISFPASFCNGLLKESCQNVKSKTACESHDVVTIEDGSISSGTDRIIDCEWNITSSACTPK